MTDSPPTAIGFTQVFEDELAYLRRRRRNVRGDAAPGEAEGPSDSLPTTEHELVGLALSGGGLGSSTFQLGALEELDRAGVFDHVDYLSTVSSGGFVGSTISTAMRDGGDFPFREAADGRASPYLSWLRSSLADTWKGGIVSYARSFGVLLRGMLLNLLMLLPVLLVFAVVAVWAHGGLLVTWEAADRRSAEAREVAAAAASEADWAEKRALGGDPAASWEAAVEAKERAVAAARAAETARTDWERAGKERGGLLRVTPWIAGLFLLLVLISPVLTWVHEVFRHGEEEESSGRAGGWAETVFGILLVLLLGAALFEVWPLWFRYFHQTADIPYRGFYALIGSAAALAVCVAAGKKLAVMGGLRQKISMLVVGLLALATALGVVFFVAEGLIYPVAGIEAAAATPPTPAYRVDANAVQPVAFGDPVEEAGILLLIIFGGLGAASVGRMPRSKLRTILIPVGVAIGALVGYSGMVGFYQGLAWVSGKMGSEGIRPDLLWLAGAVLIFGFCFLAIDVNRTSPLGLYRGRLAGLYLVGVRDGGGGKARELYVEPDYGLSELCGGDTGIAKGPYHLLNAAVNLHGSRDLLRRRSHGAFTFGKHYCGGERTGYCRSEQLERVFPQSDLQTAMAISAAGVSPNASRLTSRIMVALMTLLNVRLGYWVPNPGRLSDWLLRRSADTPFYDRSRWQAPTIVDFVRELLGAVDERHRMVNLSDGGNVDDTAAFELLRRRCKYVIVVDGTPEPDHTCGSLILLRRRAQLDLGVDIDVSLEGLRLDRDRQTRRHAATGRILYPPAAEGGKPETGLLLYVKPALSGDEDDLIAERRVQSPDFPHESAAREGLDDRQFSAYRALGLHSVAGLFEAPPEDRASSRLDTRQFREWFQGLDERLTPKGIFISYRRADASGHALLIHKALEKRFPNAEVFLDVGGIEPGEEFTSAIEETLDRSRITLVLIGNQWLGLEGADGTRRLDDPDDTVRSEISMSLAKGKRVIPLLVEHTPMPTEEDLPDELRRLAYQNAVNLTHERFDSDLETLLRILEAFLD